MCVVYVATHLLAKPCWLSICVNTQERSLTLALNVTIALEITIPLEGIFKSHQGNWAVKLEPVLTCFSFCRHMMRHTGERPYKCPYCSYTSIQSNCYKAHLRNRHPGESGLFSCASCSFQTISQDAYVQHVADHQKGLIPHKEDKNVSNNGRLI